MSNNSESISEIRFGNVSGGITNSIFAGRDISDVTITVGGQPVPANKKPTFEELKQLLAEVQQELADIVAQEEALKKISAATPYTAKGAEENLKEVAEKVKPDVDKEEGKTIGERLKETTGILNKILDGAKNLVQKSVDLGKALEPVTDKLGPLVDKVAVAALWAAKLWS